MWDRSEGQQSQTGEEGNEAPLLSSVVSGRDETPSLSGP